MEQLIVQGRTCYLDVHGDGGPVVLWGMFPFTETEPEHTRACVEKALEERSYVLAAFTVTDWDREFSPWAAPQAFGDVPFAGEGRETLDWVEKSFVPYLREQYGKRPLYLMGYSLAGLWSLWALYETDLFAGAACCSGSLWYQGWAEYVKIHHIRENCLVYLSLGGKEEKTKNQLMKTVGDRTREQEKILKKERMVKKVKLEWNSGGHFADSGARLGKGVKWLLSQEVTERVLRY